MKNNKNIDADLLLVVVFKNDEWFLLFLCKINDCMDGIMNVKK